MPTLTCIILLDHATLVEKLKKDLAAFPNLDIVATYSNAENLDPETSCDLVFIGFRLLNELSSAKLSAIRRQTRYLFTVFDHHVCVEVTALSAHSNTDIVNRNLLTQMIHKIGNDIKPEPQRRLQEYFYVRQRGVLIKVLFNDIIAFESNLHYIVIHTLKSKITFYGSLKNVQNLIAGRTDFIQVHRSFIISEKHIDSIDNYHVRLPNLNLSIGRNYKRQFDLIIDQKTFA